MRLLSGALASVAALGAAATLLLPAPAPAKQPALMVYKGAGCDGRAALPEFERFIGRPVDGVIDFIDQDSWAEFDSSSRWIADCWSGSPYDLVLSVPMLPKEDGVSMRAGASGAYDERFAKLARMLVETGYGDIALRVGWEFDGGWYPWSASRDPDAFVPYFRRIVRTMRAVEGDEFTFVWNFNLGYNESQPDRFYPGDDVVDVIAADVYNQSWRPEDIDGETRRRNLHEQAYGLDFLETFAREHGKPIAIPEWGTGVRPDGRGFGDDPEFITTMAAWIERNPVVFHGYWDYPAEDYNAQLSTGRYPRAAEAFRRAFGASR